MLLRWSRRSRDDLERIWHFQADRDVDRADRIVDAIRDRARFLTQYPLAARRGRRPGTREYLLRDLQYLLVYSIDEDAGLLFILSVQSTLERA